MTTETVSTLPPTSVATYAFGSVGTGVFSTVPSILLLYYATETLGLNPAAVGVLILLPKVFSMIWDPFVGAWSDAASTKWGRRRPFLFFGAIGTSAFFYAVFSAPTLPPLLLLIWVGAAYFCMNGFYSLFAVPYTAIPAEISRTEQDVVRLVGMRMMMLMGGIFIGGALAPMLVAHFGGGRAGYAAMASVVAVSCLIAMVLPVGMLKRHDRPQENALPKLAIDAFLQGLRTVFAHTIYRNLLIAFAAMAAAYGSVSATLPYFITTVLARSEDDVGLGLGVVIVASFAGVPFWGWLVRTLSYRVGIAIAAIGYAAAIVALATMSLRVPDWMSSLTLLAAAGLFFAGLQVLPFSFAADIVRVSAPQNEATFAGIWVATEKLGLASGALFLSLALSVDKSKDMISGFLAFGPGLLIAISLLPLFFTAAQAHPNTLKRVRQS